MLGSLIRSGHLCCLLGLTLVAFGEDVCTRSGTCAQQLLGRLRVFKQELSFRLIDDMANS